MEFSHPIGSCLSPTAVQDKLSIREAKRIEFATSSIIRDTCDLLRLNGDPIGVSRDSVEAAWASVEAAWASIARESRWLATLAETKEGERWANRDRYRTPTMTIVGPCERELEE